MYGLQIGALKALESAWEEGRENIATLPQILAALPYTTHGEVAMEVDGEKQVHPSGNAPLFPEKYREAEKMYDGKRENHIIDESGAISALSEFAVLPDAEGRFTKKGEPVLVAVHGGGALTPEYLTRRMEGSGAITAWHRNLLKGSLPADEQVRIYTVEDVLEDNVEDPFGKYAVVVTPDKTTCRRDKPHWDKRIRDKPHWDSDSETRYDWVSNPVALAYTGSREIAGRFYDFVTEGLTPIIHLAEGRSLSFPIVGKQPCWDIQPRKGYCVKSQWRVPYFFATRTPEQEGSR